MTSALSFSFYNFLLLTQQHLLSIEVDKLTSKIRLLLLNRWRLEEEEEEEAAAALGSFDDVVSGGDA